MLECFLARCRARRRLVGAVLVAVALSGCVSGTLPAAPGVEEAAAEPLRAPGAPADGPFSPPFELVAPQVRVFGSEGVGLEAPEAGAALTLAAVFPAEAGVDTSKVTAYLWKVGDATLAGAEVRYAPDAPGVVRIELTVHDAYGRSATAVHELDVR